MLHFYPWTPTSDWERISPYRRQVLGIKKFIYQAPVVQSINKANHWINLCPIDSIVSFLNSYPLDSNLSVG